MEGKQRRILIPLSLLMLFFFMHMQAVFAGDAGNKDPKVDKDFACIGCETSRCGATASTWKELFRKIFSAKNTKQENLNKGGQK
jgi:hypothetical protein